MIPKTAATLFQEARQSEAAGSLEAACKSYRAASRADPRHLPARLALARLLARLGRPDEAVSAYEALLARAPMEAPAWLELGWLHGGQRRFRDALTCFDRAEALGADAATALSETAHGMAHACDWSVRSSLIGRLAARLDRPEPCVMQSYALLAASDDPALHRRMAEHVAAAIARHAATMPRPPHRPSPGGRIRLGYLSSDFNRHATSLLMAGVFERHDRGRFELFAYDHSLEDGTPMRARVRAAFDHFSTLGTEGPAESAARVAADGIDILIDLKGYTEGTRAEIAALRPAPVQASFLGYPGTSGAPWIDYVLADASVLPMAEQPNWTERIVHLPGSYQPNDRTRPIPPPDSDRAARGLPGGAMVLACFNNSYKITPEVFAIWMNLLRQLPNAVLWLYEGNPFVAGNLRAEATRAGIAPERLVFAPQAELPAHLARHACADLFLDTAPYGAHTTGADALWAGLPMITCAGRSFASRVGASLLGAAGLPELVTGSLDEYAALALALALDPARLAGMRAQLVAARDTAALFDAARFTSGLEAALTTMMDRHRAGLPPAAFAVE